MSGLMKDVYTKCAECGSSARLMFDARFDPWKYVAVCDNCKQLADPGTTQGEAIDNWDRRQRENVSIHTKCAQCGGTARMKSDVLAEPWNKHYVVVCEDCGECSEPSHSFIKTLNDWERRQKENMKSKKTRKFLVIKEDQYFTNYKVKEYDSLEDAVYKAKQALEGLNKDKNIYVAEVIAKSKTDRQIVFTGDEE